MSGSATSTAKVRLSIPAGVDPTRVTGPADALLRAAERRCEASVTVREMCIRDSSWHRRALHVARSP